MISIKHFKDSRVLHKIQTSPSPFEKIIFSDTTLRDGEQTPGCALQIEEKLQIAKHLAKARMDIIEAGFAQNPNGGGESVRRIADEIGSSDGPIISTLSLMTRKGIDISREALAGAEKRRLHTFIATSDLHMNHKLRKTREEVLGTISEMITYAKTKFEDIQFSPEDAGRSDVEFLYQAIERAIDAGATVINVPDTVGYMLPHQYMTLIEGIRKNVPNIDKAIISTHTHNDLGNAVANSISGIMGGARQVEGTINGIGERAGNADLTTVIATLDTHPELFRGIIGHPEGSDHKIVNVQHSELFSLSKTVSGFTIPIPRNYPVMGANAFAHESGVHQDGVSKNISTYEILDPKKYGIPEREMTLSINSGKAGFISMCKLCEIELKDAGEADSLYGKYLGYLKGFDGKSVDKFEFLYWYNTPKEFNAKWKISEYEFTEKNLQSNSSNNTSTILMSDLLRAESDFIATSESVKGPIDANINVVNKIIGVYPDESSFRFQVDEQGSDAKAYTFVTIKIAGIEYQGKGIDSNTIIAATEAYINAINRYLSSI